MRRRGCNGFSYVMDYARSINKMDEVVNDKGVRLLIDAKALMFVVGTEMDYVTSDIKSEFVFNNPNSKVSRTEYSGKLWVWRELQCRLNI